MAIHVNIGEAKTRLSELVAAAKRGEDVVLNKAGEPQVRLVPITEERDVSAAARAARRKAAFGKWRHLARDPDNVIVPPSMTDEDIEERWRRKFGPAD